MWNAKTNVVPVITKATETTSESFRKYPRRVSGKHEIKELQKTAILSLHTYFGKY
jgi:septin family protein